MVPQQNIQEWDQKCNNLDRAITNKTVTLKQVEDFFAEEVQRPSKLMTIATGLKDTILQHDETQPSESNLASLYFLKKASETNFPGSQKLPLDEITERYNAMRLQVNPSDLSGQQTNPAIYDIYKIFNIKSGVILAAIAFVVYYGTRKKKELSNISK